jgi:predicted nuclease with RNAse H fold
MARMKNHCPRFVVGMDLSGPSNIQETSLAVFNEKGNSLVLKEMISGAADLQIFHLTVGLADQGDVIVGIDAPLSYNPGGGDRPGDRRLRTQMINAGLPSGTVMTPTMTRMAYLTLRGIVIARLLASLAEKQLHLVEVHPTASLVLRGAPLEAVLSMKSNLSSRKKLLSWLESQGLKDLSSLTSPSDHDLAACAAGLAAWYWQRGEPCWLEPADPPLHPFDYAC